MNPKLKVFLRALVCPSNKWELIICESVAQIVYSLIILIPCVALIGYMCVEEIDYLKKDRAGEYSVYHKTDLNFDPTEYLKSIGYLK